MSYQVYILRSINTGRHYCGQTNNLDRRIREHNDPEYRRCKTTKNFEGPWEIVWSNECLTRSEAMLLERKIKRRGIERFLINSSMVESRQGGINQ